MAATLGDYVRVLRKSKKITSIALSKQIGKSNAYISHIENGRNKNPDYETMFDLFKYLGVEEGKIEGILYQFGIISPKITIEEIDYFNAQVEDAENPSEAYLKKMEEDAEYYSSLEEEDKRMNRFKEFVSLPRDSNSDELLYDILNSVLLEMFETFQAMLDSDQISAFDFIRGFQRTLHESSTNPPLYNFLRLLFKEDIHKLDEKGLMSVINTIYKELDRITEERENMN